GVHLLILYVATGILLLVVVEEIDDALRPLLGPVLAGGGDADQHPNRAVLREMRRQRLPEGVAGRNEALADEGLTGIALGALGVVDIRSDDDDTLVARTLDQLVEGLVVDNRRDQRVGLGGERGLHVGLLLGDRALGLGEEHLAIRLDLAAG